MSEVTNTQPAVDAPDATVTPVVEGNDAQNNADDLDSLLNEFDVAQKPAATKETQPEQKPAADSDLQSRLNQMEGFVNQAEARQFRQDMDKTISSIRGDLDPEMFDDKLVQAWLDVQAQADQRLQEAWLNRHSKPKQFEKVVESLGRNFVKKYGQLPDKAATEDREAVTAAVRGASTKTPEGKAPDFSGMSNAEYRETHKKQFGYYPNV